MSDKCIKAGCIHTDDCVTYEKGDANKYGGFDCCDYEPEIKVDPCDSIRINIKTDGKGRWKFKEMTAWPYGNEPSDEAPGLWVSAKVMGKPTKKHGLIWADGTAVSQAGLASYVEQVEQVEYDIAQLIKERDELREKVRYWLKKAGIADAMWEKAQGGSAFKAGYALGVEHGRAYVKGLAENDESEQ